MGHGQGQAGRCHGIRQEDHQNSGSKSGILLYAAAVFVEGVVLVCGSFGGPEAEVRTPLGTTSFWYMRRARFVISVTGISPDHHGSRREDRHSSATDNCPWKTYSAEMIVVRPQSKK